MSTLILKREAVAAEVRCDDDALHVRLTDGREISVPLAWFPRLANATPDQRRSFRLIGRGLGIRWDGLDEDISVPALL